MVDPAEASASPRSTAPRSTHEIERRSHSILGKIALEPGRGAFPLRSRPRGSSPQAASRWSARPRTCIPPIGAQGLNLGLRDAATIGELVVAARRTAATSARDELLARYDAHAARRRAAAAAFAVDLLNRTLLTDFLPVQGARGLGLYLIDRIGPLRRAVMREGVAPSPRSRG